MVDTLRLKTSFLCLTLVINILLTPIYAEYVGIGSCPAVTGATGFNRFNLGGVWYEQRRYDSLFAKTLKCISYNFNFFFNFQVDITAVQILTGRSFQLHGRIIPSPFTSLNTYVIDYDNFKIVPQKYTIIAFSANNYKVLYSCQAYGFFYVAQAVILTRLRIPPATTISAANAALAGQGLPIGALKSINQAQC